MIYTLVTKWNQFKENFLSREKGAVDLIVIVILIAVVVGLALIFKKTITKIITDLLDKIKGDVEQI